MSCTLEELQKTEYEILCEFADFCEKHNLEYVLAGGTLLGAVRHNGFIPWDDDIDVYMEVHDFKKFVKLIKKNPVQGLHLSWLDTEPQSPFCFAKLRRCGTFFPSLLIETLDMHNGVWIDIFTYSGYPKNHIAQKIQSKTYLLFSLLGSYYRSCTHDLEKEYNKKYQKAMKILSKMSTKTINRLRKILFSFYSSLGSKKSEYVVFNDWFQESTGVLPRKNYTPSCKHLFNDREFNIPINYDDLLTRQYGDYMTPVVFHSHANLSRIVCKYNR